MRLFLSVAACLLAGGAVHAKTLATTRSCSEWFQPRTYQNAITAAANPQYDRPAVIFGKSVRVLPMRIRIVDAATGAALKTKDVKLAYSWDWLEYPYPEHAWGAWSSTSDDLKCSPDNEGWIEAPLHDVQPRGWYDGKYTRFPWLRRPHFTGLGFTAISPRGLFARFSLRPSDLKKFEKFDLIVIVRDGWRTELNWVGKQGR